MNWEDKTTVKKGNLGEQIVKETLENSGYVIYKCITEKAHAFDFLAVKNKQVFMIAEVKSKARFNNFEATGIDVKHYNEYLFILDNQNIDVMLFFVDEHPKEERVYCQSLNILKQEKDINGIRYPNFNISKGKVLFTLSDMITVCKLTEDQINKLKKYSSRNYIYK